MDHRIGHRLGLRLPIIQAPMAGVSSPALAAAVSNAGGLGSLALGASPAPTAEQMIADTRALTDRPINVNLFCHQPARADRQKEAAWLDRLTPEFARFDAAPPATLHDIYPSFLTDAEMLAVLLKARPEVISFHFGLPDQAFLTQLKSTGAILLASATNSAEADAAERAGINGIVAQGIEAGGHRGCFDPDAKDDALPLRDLLPRLRRQTQLPLIAAGGIMTGADIAQAQRQGATLVQMGTAFIGCPESLADQGYRDHLFADGPKDTVLTRLYSGRPARGLHTDLTRWGADVDDSAIPDYPRAYDAAKALHAAAKAQGHTGYGAYWAGQQAAKARPLPAAQLMRELAQELTAASA